MKSKYFRLDEIFTLKKGKRLTKADMIEGSLNYIGAISDNNGVRQKIDAPKQYDGNCITVIITEVLVKHFIKISHSGHLMMLMFFN